MLIIWLGYLYLTLCCYFCWTLNGLILFLAVKRGYSGEKKNSPKCIAPLENINWLFENVNHFFPIFKIIVFYVWVTFLFGYPRRHCAYPWGYIVLQFGNTCSIPMTVRVLTTTAILPRVWVGPWTSPTGLHWVVWQCAAGVECLQDEGNGSRIQEEAPQDGPGDHPWWRGGHCGPA